MAAPRAISNSRSMMLLRLTISLVLSLPLVLEAQEPNNGKDQNQAELWFAEANKVYDYGKLEQANNKYAIAKRAFTACIPHFERFANTYPKHPDAAVAIYRSGVAYLLIGQRKQAESKFVTTLIKTKKKGQTAALAAFRLGALAYNDEHFKTALPHFVLTAAQAEKPEIRHKALNYQARCLLLSKRIPEAAVILHKLVDDPNRPNIFREPSRLALAHIAATTGKLDEAFELYNALAEEIDSVDATLLGIKAQAIVHGGMTAMQIGKSEEGLSMLKTALRTIGLPDESKAEAQLTLMQHEFSNENHDSVLELFRTGSFQAARSETTAKILLLSGRSSAKLGRHNAAVEMFIGVDRTAPNTRLAYESSYRKLLSFFEMRGTNVPELAGSFIELYKGEYPKSPWIQLARVMRAETYFSFENYQDATDAWARVDYKYLPKKLHGPCLFKSGWSLVENGDYNNAVGILSEFISRYPDSPDLHAAVSKRAQSYLEVGDRISALADCERILEHKKNAPALASFALQLSGRLYRREGRNDKMIEVYQELLKNYQGLTHDTIARANYNMGLGYFDKGEFETSLLHLEKARSLVPEFYEDPAGTTISLCYYRLKEAELLRQNVTRLYQVNPNKILPRRLLVWLGLEMYENSNFTAANHYLSLVIDSEEPSNVESGIWKAVAKSRIEIPSQEEKALEAITHILRTENDPFWRCDTFLDKANALIALNRWNEAEISTHRGLDLEPQGTIKAGLHLALGDISLARANYNAAASSYVRAAEFFLNDSAIQPIALYKAAWCLNKTGNKTAANAFEERLRLDHPNWKAPHTFKIKPGSALDSIPKPIPTPATVQEEPDLPTGIVPINN